MRNEPEMYQMGKARITMLKITKKNIFPLKEREREIEIAIFYLHRSKSII